jgi:GntR family transcriptional repressor for pyruvate dehydrogenase complex
LDELRAGTLAERLSRRLAEQIVSGTLPLGSRLPTEERLAADYGVSRSVVRESFASLRSDGLIQIRQGQGATVASSLVAVPFRITEEALISQEGIVEVFELRLAVESEAAAMAAERATAAQRRAIEKAYKTLHKLSRADGDGVEEDFNFHHAIVQGANNRRFSEFVEFLSRKIHSQATITRKKSERMNRLMFVVQEHTAIYDAVMAGNADAARTAARDHFKNGITRLLDTDTH